MKPGKRQREILDILQDDAEWMSGELYNDAGFWTASIVAIEDGTRYSKRVQSDPARRLHEQGYVMHARTEPGAGLWGADRVVFVLTEKGKAAPPTEGRDDE